MSLLRQALLMLHAGRLVSAAQPLRRGRPIPAVLQRLCRMRGLPTAVDAIDAHRAVGRAANRLRTFGLTDTCLIRSLALAALLADHEEVRVHLGFSAAGPPTEILAGHAWVTLGGQPLPDEEATRIDGRSCDEVARLEATRVRARSDDRKQD